MKNVSVDMEKMNAIPLSEAVDMVKLIAFLEQHGG